MSIQSALTHIEATLRAEVTLPAHVMRQLLNDIDAHLPRHLTDEVLMAAIDDFKTGVDALNASIPKLIAQITADGSGQSAAVAELADVNTKLTLVAQVLVAINSSVDGALNPPAPATVDTPVPVTPVADPTIAPATAPAGSVLG